ncbi:acyl-CoA N-acyltransferase [Microthyrium microscopicum]|uniref:Acyl-CoA N-acyltransferase n=1 Tax=Microthyrium microscopicum TaxID=703497 RepID=A0A6A6U5W2_9PEZI|nr:acyl-CoA N-acyltransferase [Microthyrium microscopicum]
MANEIYTSRLILRPIAVTDAPELHAIRSQEEVYRHIWTGPWKSISETEEWIQEIRNGPRSIMYTILQKEETTIIGIVGVNRWDKVHYMIDPKFWNRGYATEALAAFLVAFFKLQPKRLCIQTLLSAENHASRKVLEKCGFVHDAPKPYPGPPTTSEPSEEEEMEAISGAGSNPAPSDSTLYFIYIKPT